MKTIAIRVALVTVPLACAGAVIYGRGMASSHALSHANQGFHNHKVIPQPQNWVPFSAQIKRVYEKSGEVVVGRVYRSSDGSTRSETGPSLDAINTIGIKNISTRSFYMWQGNDTWTAQPMELPPEGWHP